MLSGKVLCRSTGNNNGTGEYRVNTVTNIRGVTVRDGSVCTSVLTSLFVMVSVQQAEKTKHKIASFFY